MEKKMTVDVSPALDLKVSTPWSANIGMDMMVRVDGTPYTGQTAVIPSDTRQVLPTSGTLLTQDITIEPIPQNYGLITWNGSTLTVS